MSKKIDKKNNNMFPGWIDKEKCDDCNKELTAGICVNGKCPSWKPYIKHLKGR